MSSHRKSLAQLVLICAKRWGDIDDEDWQDAVAIAQQEESESE